MADYIPQDEQYLWSLVDPNEPKLVGTLRLIKRPGPGIGGVSLEYVGSWLEHGFAISEDLPLRAGEVLPREKEAAVGAVEDARPDRWGERIIRYIERPSRLSTLEYLYFAGDERFGALGVSLSSTSYATPPHGAIPTLGDVDGLRTLVRRVESGEQVDERMRRLLGPGTLGGARPKAIIEIEGRQWIAKFSETGDDFDSPLIEHASMSLAVAAGIHACETLPISLRPEASSRAASHAVAVRRFDRVQGARIHAQTAAVALSAAGEEFGYPELALLMRRRGNSDQIENNGQELFRRMVFNILIDNTDDHERNHAVLRGPNGLLELAPAYDVLPTAQSLGYQSFKVGVHGTEPTIDNALSEHHAFRLSLSRARELCREVALVANGWADHFRANQVHDRDVELLSAHIDRPALRGERDLAIAARRTHVPRG